MEGSFGNQKQHYGVGRIVARNARSETLLLFLGIHMANAVTIAARKNRSRREREASAGTEGIKIEYDFDSPTLSELIVVPLRLKFSDFAHARQLFFSSSTNIREYIGASPDSVATI